MTTKLFTGIVALAAAALTTAHASFELTPGTNLFLTGTAGIKYSDNIFLASSNEKSSAIIDLIPGISLEMGSAALTKNVFTYSEDFVTYTDASSQNTQLAEVQYDGSYSDSKLSMKLNAGYHQLAQNTRDVRLNGVIVHTDVTNATPTAEVVISPKTTFGAGVDYENTHYTSAGFSDLTAFAVPVNFYYEVEPKLQASVGYKYTHNQVDAPGTDSDENYLNVGARGEFTPKLHGTVNVGYVQDKIESGNGVKGTTESSLGLNANLDYQYSGQDHGEPRGFQRLCGRRHRLDAKDLRPERRGGLRLDRRLERGCLGFVQQLQVCWDLPLGRLLPGGGRADLQV